MGRPEGFSEMDELRRSFFNDDEYAFPATEGVAGPLQELPEETVVPVQEVTNG